MEKNEKEEQKNWVEDDNHVQFITGAAVPYGLSLEEIGFESQKDN